MEIIDAHAHADEAEAFGWYDPPEKLIRFMDEAGIAKAVMTTYADEPGPEAALERLLDYAARYSNRFIPFARMDPRYGDRVLKLFRDAVLHYSVRGLKLHPVSTITHPFGDASVRLIRLASELGVPVLIHSGDQTMCEPWQIAEAARLAPDAAIIMGHMGGFFHAPEAIRAAEVYPNIYLETSAMPYTRLIREAISRIGVRRVLFGSDQPAGHPKVELKKIEVLKLPPRDNELVLGGNIARLLGLKKAA